MHVPEGAVARKDPEAAVADRYSSLPSLWPRPSGGAFQGNGVYRSDGGLGQRKKVILAPAFIVSLSRRITPYL